MDDRSAKEVVADARETYRHAAAALAQYATGPGDQRRAALRTFLNESRSVVLTMQKVKRKASDRAWAEDFLRRLEGEPLVDAFAAVRDDLDHGSRLRVSSEPSAVSVGVLNYGELHARFPAAVSFSMGVNGASYWMDAAGRRHYFDDDQVSARGGDAFPDAPDPLSSRPLERSAHEYLDLLDRYLVEAMIGTADS